MPDLPNPDTHATPPVAELVVWRHPCDCPTASRPLEPGEEAEHRFDVDGHPFPWFITENGAAFLKRGDLYLVRVAILPIEPDTPGYPLLDVTIPGELRRPPRIGDRPFPWAILNGSISVEVTEGAVPILHLTFLANDVDADLEIPVDRWTARDPHDQGLEFKHLAAKIEARRAHYEAAAANPRYEVTAPGSFTLPEEGDRHA